MTIWRTAAFGGFATTMAAVIDERPLVAFGALAVFALIWVGIVREVGELRRRRWLNDPKTWAGFGQPDYDDMCPNCVTPWKCNGPHEVA